MGMAMGVNMAKGRNMLIYESDNEDEHWNEEGMRTARIRKGKGN